MSYKEKEIKLLGISKFHNAYLHFSFRIEFILINVAYKHESYHTQFFLLQMLNIDMEIPELKT